MYICICKCVCEYINICMHMHVYYVCIYIYLGIVFTNEHVSVFILYVVFDHIVSHVHKEKENKIKNKKFTKKIC